MAAQQTVSNLAKMLGEKIADAHKAAKDAPVDKGFVSLPGGIRNGVFQLREAYIALIDKGDDKGKPYFRASGVVKSPEYAPNGEPCKGLTTSLMVRLFDQKPFKQADGTVRTTTFADGWAEYLNFFKLFNVDMPPDQQPSETKIAAAQRVEAYFQAATKQLLISKPHCTFSTREYTAKATPANPKPSTRVYETWHGFCPPPAALILGGGMADQSGEPTDPPPAGEMAPSPGPDAIDAGPPHNPIVATDAPDAGDEQTPPDGADIESLIAVADADPTGTTAEGKEAIAAITALAVNAGVPKETMDAAANWAEVAALAAAMLAPDEPPVEEPAAPPKPDPIKGARVKYSVRKPDGTPMMGKNGPLPPIDCEVLAVNAATKIATLKNLKTKLAMLGADKKLLQVPFDHLEA